LISAVVLIGCAVAAVALASATSGPASPVTTTTVVSINRAQLYADQLSHAAGCPSDPDAPVRKPSWSSAPAMTIDPGASYSAHVVTDAGSFTITLDAAAAPKSVDNFVFLARHGYFECLTFFRAVPQSYLDNHDVTHQLSAFAASGDPTGSGSGGPGYEYSEVRSAAADAITQFGTVVMIDMRTGDARAAYGSQFMIIAGTPHPSPQNSEPFGYVSSGIDVVQEISGDGNATPGDDGRSPRVVHRIFEVTITQG